MADINLQSITFPGLSDRYVVNGLSDDAKDALLDCFEHVAWTDDQGQTYYDALYDALYPRDVASISAVYTQSGTVYDTATLDSLKTDLVVTATYTDSTTATVAASAYTLSGTLTAGTSTIAVSYSGFTTTFTVTVTHDAEHYAVTNNLTGCTSSNASTTATEGGSYAATITADSGYTLTGATVSVTMGGTDITSSAYSNGTISIASVTGAVVITVTAVAVTLSSISAVFTQSGTVYDTDSLDSLKSDLVVTATYSDSSTATIAANDYTLSGTLAEGTSTITVSYGGQTATFNVTVTSSTVLYQLASPFTSIGSNSIDTEQHLIDGDTITIAQECTISEFRSTIDYVFGTRINASVAYTALQVQSSGGSNYIWGVGIPWNSGKNFVAVNDVIRSVHVLSLNAGGSELAVSTFIKNKTTNKEFTFTNTYEANEGQSYTTPQIIIGNPMNGVGFRGTMNDFVITRGAWTSEEISEFLNGE